MEAVRDGVGRKRGAEEEVRVSRPRVSVPGVFGTSCTTSDMAGTVPFSSTTLWLATWVTCAMAI